MSSSIRALALVLAIAVSPYQAAAGEARLGTLVLDPSKTLIEFRLPGSIHTTHGIFKLEHGTIRADLAAGEASGLIVVDARSGDSGIGARDDRMKNSVLEVQRYPTVTLEPRHVSGRLAEDGQFQARLQGVLTLHGAGHEIVMDVHGQVVGDSLVAKSHFLVPYVEWGLTDPSVLFFTVAKQVDVVIATEGHIVWTGEPARRSAE
jgi:polyisoprenoid-binding protein YceI